MEKACVHGSNPLKDGAMLILGYPIEMLPDDAPSVAIGPLS
jgi:hypothetical protein